MTADTKAESVAEKLEMQAGEAARIMEESHTRPGVVEIFRRDTHNQGGEMIFVPKPGWLRRDGIRAARRVAEWSIPPLAAAVHAAEQSLEGARRAHGRAIWELAHVYGLF